MHIAPPARPTSDGVYVMHAGDPAHTTSSAPASRPEPSVGSAAWAKYGHWFLDMPGALSVSYRSNEPTTVRVRVEAPELAAIGRAAFNDVIEGATILWESQGELPTTPPGGLPYNWWENPSNAARAIGGLNGVTRMDRGVAGVSIWAEDDATQAALKLALRKQLVPGYWVGVQRMPHPPARPPKPTPDPRSATS